MNELLFRKNLYKFYQKHKRDLIWREQINGYYILVSEIMLQQTQVSRVIILFQKFIEKFPTMQALAEASVTSVLEYWSGLGYNRRALYLQNAAQIILNKYEGIIPDDYTKLEEIKGIGNYTARAIITYLYNIPLIFVETNIRSVFFILFSKKYHKIEHTTQGKISDIPILEQIKMYLDKTNPRAWYYALMDFGTYLKKKYRNKHIQKSSKFTTQSNFNLSKRKIRGIILKIILKEKSLRIKNLIDLTKKQKINEKLNIEECIVDLWKENFLDIFSENTPHDKLLELNKEIKNCYIKIKEAY